MPRLDEPTRRFLKALGPAIIGAGGVQLALFADTLIASFLPTGALSALYYADRINQLPIGVVGIAVGTVLLPEMSRRLAAGDEKGAASRKRAASSSRCSSPSLRGGLHRHSRSHHARAVCPRRLHGARRGRGGRHARRLFVRPFALRADAELHRAVLCARRYRDAGQGRAARRRHQHPVEGAAHGASRASRPRARHQRRRLDQFEPARAVRPPPGLRRVGHGHRQAGGEVACLGRGARRRRWSPALMGSNARLPA